MLDEQLQLDQLSYQQLVDLLGHRERCIRYEAYNLLKAAGQSILDAAIDGLAHENPLVRRSCADLMDHLGDDRCIEPLIELTNDPIPKVRRQAVHSLACDRCKGSPLCIDLIPLLIHVVQNEPNAKVRGEAVFGIFLRPKDQRVIAPLRSLIDELSQKGELLHAEQLLRKGADKALRWHQQ